MFQPFMGEHVFAPFFFLSASWVVASLVVCCPNAFPNCDAQGGGWEETTQDRNDRSAITRHEAAGSAEPLPDNKRPLVEAARASERATASAPERRARGEDPEGWPRVDHDHIYNALRAPQECVAAPLQWSGHRHGRSAAYHDVSWRRFGLHHNRRFFLWICFGGCWLREEGMMPLPPLLKRCCTPALHSAR